MIPHIRVTQETMKNIYPNYTGIPTDIIKAFNETAHNQLIDSRDTNHEARINSETTRVIVLTAHAHQVVFALEIDAQAGASNIHVLNHRYATCHVLDVAVHNVHLQIANGLYHLNRSKRI